MEAAFVHPRNITFHRHAFLITKQLRGETVEHFYGKLKEIAKNCDFKNNEETLIRDVFITNLIDPEIQKNSQTSSRAASSNRIGHQYGTGDKKSASNSTA